MILMHGSLYIANKTHNPIYERCITLHRLCAMLLIILFSIAGIWVVLGIDGYIVTSSLLHDIPSNPLVKTVITKSGAWAKNYSLMPWTIIAPVLAIGGAILALVTSSRFTKFAFVASSLSLIGIITTVGLSMFPFILPSSTHPNSSLTLWDASSSQMTLFIMLIVAVTFLPLIILYTSWVYRVLRGKLDESIVETESNAY